jgi:GNAT superfamily N-acetyltransferase
MLTPPPRANPAATRAATKGSGGSRYPSGAHYLPHPPPRRYLELVIEIRTLNPTSARQHLDALAEVLLDCVHGGASVSFMASITKPEADAFFEKTIEAVERGERILLAAFDDSQLIGTVQILTATPPNQPHRADVAKLLVNRAARGKGIAALLMQHVEQESRSAGKTLLVLDTVTGGDAEKLYLRLGWTKSGIIPNYALFPDGRLCDTTIFWKDLS